MLAPRASRRRFLATAGAATCTTLVAPAWVGASDLSLSDRIDLLYSTQFHFNRRGEPQITVGLSTGRPRVRLSAPGGLVVLPSGDGGTRITGASSLEITVHDGKPAHESFAIVLEELTMGATRDVATAVARWKKRGHEPTEHEVGTVFGIKGHVVDTRRLLLTDGRWSSEDEAWQQAKALKESAGALGQLHPIVHRRSSGKLVARDPGGELEVAAEGVLWFAPARDEPITVHDVVTEGKTEDRQYHGHVYVALDRHGTLAVVNLVSETHLLSGLVPAEIYASAPMAALRAQAVAARGQLVAKVGTRHLDDPFLVCAEQHCQVYAGRGHEHARTTEAVVDTSGVVAMRPGGTRLVDTVYSANCGGHTEHNEHVWPSPPDDQLRGHADALVPARFSKGIDSANLRAWLEGTPTSYSLPRDDERATAYRWVASLDPAAVAHNPGVPEGLGTLESIAVLARGTSGRATRVRLEGSERTVEINGELRIRRALGGLKSSMFMVLPERDAKGRWQLRGGGHGHGVGLCQHGAMGMASAGREHGEILAHYYQGAEIVELW